MNTGTIAHNGRWWSTGSGQIELLIRDGDWQAGYHSGDCDDDIKALRVSRRYLATQLDALNPELVRSELREYGAWSDTELMDHNQNLSRLLWIACGDLLDDGGSL